MIHNKKCYYQNHVQQEIVFDFDSLTSTLSALESIQTKHLPFSLLTNTLDLLMYVYKVSLDYVG